MNRTSSFARIGLVIFGTWLAPRFLAIASDPPSYLAAAKPVVIPVKEPSGVAYHPGRNTVLVVSDDGVLVELDLDLKEKHRWRVEGDLEGIAVHPRRGTVYIAVERANEVLEFDLDSGSERNRFRVALGSHPEYLDARDANLGMEGIALVPAESDDEVTVYVVIETAPPRLLRLTNLLQMPAMHTLQVNQPVGTAVESQPMAMVDRGWDPGLRSLNDLMFDAATQTFLVTGARDKALRVLDASARELRTFELPGPYPEGFCFLPNGDGLVVHDSGGGHLIPNFRDVVYPRP